MNSTSFAEESSSGPVTHFLGISCPEINVRGRAELRRAADSCGQRAGGRGGWAPGLEFRACPHQQKSSMGQHAARKAKRLAASQDLRMHHHGDARFQGLSDEARVHSHGHLARQGARRGTSQGGQMTNKRPAPRINGKD